MSPSFLPTFTYLSNMPIIYIVAFSNYVFKLLIFVISFIVLFFSVLVERTLE